MKRSYINPFNQPRASALTEEQELRYLSRAIEFCHALIAPLPLSFPARPLNGYTLGDLHFFLAKCTAMLDRVPDGPLSIETPLPEIFSDIRA